MRLNHDTRWSRRIAVSTSTRNQPRSGPGAGYRIECHSSFLRHLLSPGYLATDHALADRDRQIPHVLSTSGFRLRRLHLRRRTGYCST